MFCCRYRQGILSSLQALQLMESPVAGIPYFPSHVWLLSGYWRCKHPRRRRQVCVFGAGLECRYRIHCPHTPGMFLNMRDAKYAEEHIRRLSIHLPLAGHHSLLCRIPKSSSLILIKNGLCRLSIGLVERAGFRGQKSFVCLHPAWDSKCIFFRTGHSPYSEMASIDFA